MISRLTNSEIQSKIYEGLNKLKFCKTKKDINFIEIKKFKYAYVIYDLNHRKNVDYIIKYFNSLNIHNAGRLGSWEYFEFRSSNLSIKRISKQINKVRKKSL